jgi:hypothetical protein
MATVEKSEMQSQLVSMIVNMQLFFSFWEMSQRNSSTNYWPTSAVWKLCQGNLHCEEEKEKSNDKKISLQICTKPKIWGNGSPEELDWVTQHCSLR